MKAYVFLLALAMILSAPHDSPAVRLQAAAAQQAPTQPSSETAQPSRTQQQARQAKVQTYTLPPDKYAEAVAYAKAGYRLYFFSVAYGLIVLLAILAWRLAPKYRDWAERATPVRFLQAVIFAPLLILTLGVLGLPTDIYGHWLSRHYHQSVQGWGSWLWDWTKGELLGFIFGIFLIWILYAIIRKSPRRWWFYFWLASLPIIVFVIFLAPLVIEPLFFKFQPLEKNHADLVANLETLVQRSGLHIPPSRMFEMKASEKTNSLNAYVTGIGASKRVVVYDTTMQKMTTPEIMFVFGHELGHYVLGHILQGMAFTAGILIIFLWLGYKALGWSIRRHGERWAIRGVDDWASLPVLLLWFTIFGFIASPLSSTFSRHLEHQADIYGLEVTHGATPDYQDVAANSFQILGEVDLSDPNPSRFIEIWLFSHPSIKERIEFARRYDPWANGGNGKYVK